MSGGAWAKAQLQIFGVGAMVLATSISQAHSVQPQERTPPAPAQRAASQRTPQAMPLPPRPAPVVAETPAHRMLAARVQSLGRNFDGIVGIAVRDVATGWTTSWSGGRFFPQQSVSKFWVALNAFQRADAGELDLSERVTLRRSDLTLFHQPIAAQLGPNGYTTTINELIFRALTQSDNTCNDFVLRRGGGPDAVRAMLTRNGLSGVRFGPGERLMQSQIAGLQWQPSFSVGRAFYQARASVPLERRRTAFQNYVDDPIDGATPEGIVTALARLRAGDLLSARSTERMLSIMSQTRTGRQRLRGGLAPGWRLAHKTGTGQVLGGTQAGYNDIGILTAPNGRHYAVAVMIGRTDAPIPDRMALMQNVTRAVIAFDEMRDTGGGGHSR